jgi:4-hydroxy-tetrahydrodipicolinate reductase
LIQVVVHGAEGRMGKLITGLVSAADDCQLAGLVTEPGGGKEVGVFHPDLPLLGQEQMAEVLPARCVIVDFSLAPALDGLLRQATLLKSPLVMGTTGFTASQQLALEGFSKNCPVVQAANFSIGIPALQMLLQLLAKTLPAGFDAEQVETHHVTKIDQPSGTASHLAAVYEEARRGSEKIPTHSQRLGGTIGEHTWTFSDSEETLVLTHRAHSRNAFMRGILPSVRFVNGQDHGIYGLTHVLQGLAGDLEV